MKHRVTVVIEKDRNGYYAFCPQLEGCQSQGETLEVVLKNIRELIELDPETLSPEERIACLSNEILTTSVEFEGIA